MANERPQTDVESIIENIKAREFQKEAPEGALEYEFSEPVNKSGLVFEFVEEDIQEPLSDNTEELKEEVSIPDSFISSKNHNSTQSSSPQTKIWTTYVPRFTEASEHYRMKDDPRPRPNSAEKKETVCVQENPQSKHPEENAEPISSLDPTAELEENVEGIIVNMSVPTEDEDADRLNVYKFSENPDAKEEPKERTLEDERAEINRLIGNDESSEEEPEDSDGENDNQSFKEEKSYTIPDPTDGVRVMDFADADDENEKAPLGASDFTSEKGKIASSEFVLPIQRDGFKDRFLDSIMALKIRLCAAAVFALLIGAFELMSFLGVFVNTGFALFSFPGAIAIIDLLLSSCVFAIALPETFRAVKRLFGGRLVSDIILPSAFLVTVIYSLVIAFSGALTDYPLYGFVFAVFAFCAILATYYRISSDFSAFKLISKSGEKQILDKSLTRMLPEENMALDGIVDEYKSRTARIFRASFITDFFKRTNETTEKTSHIALILSLCFGISLVTGAVCLFLMQSFVEAASAFALVFLISSPAFALLSNKISYFYAQRSARLEDSAVVGDSSLKEFSEVDVIAFEDSEIFGPDDVNLKRFMLYGDSDNMEKALQQMCSLFSAVGGPLNFIFTGALDNRVRRNPAINTVIEDDGLSGEVSGKIISAGNEEYMRRHNIAIPEGSVRQDSGIDTTKIMYAAEQGEVYAKFYIRYSFSEEFTMLLPELRAEGIVPLIYTSDPNVSNELLKTLTAGADCMRVMKRKSAGTTDDKLYSRVSSGIVTVGEKINAISAILLTKKHKKLSERLSVSEMYAMSAGAGLAVALSLLGMTVVPSLIFGLWQISWCIVLRFATKNALLKGKDKTTDK